MIGAATGIAGTTDINATGRPGAPGIAGRARIGTATREGGTDTIPTADRSGGPTDASTGELNDAPTDARHAETEIDAKRVATGGKSVPNASATNVAPMSDAIVPSARGTSDAGGAPSGRNVECCASAESVGGTFATTRSGYALPRARS